MKYFLRGFQIAFLQRLGNVKSWLILLIVPLLLLGITLAVPAQQMSAPVQVGVVLPDAGAEDFWELLRGRSGTVLTFFETDEETLNRNIATGKWDCGLILLEDFAEKIAEADTDRLFVIRIGEGSTVYPLVRETVAACVSSLVRIPIAQEYLLSSQIVTQVDTQQIRTLLEQELTDDQLIHINMYTPDGEALHPIRLAESGINQFLRWLLAISLLIWLLLCTCDLGRWNDSSAAKRMRPLLTPTAAMLPWLVADAALGILSGCLGMAIIGGGIAGFVAITVYVLMWSGLCLLIAHFPSVWQNLPILPAFAVVTSLLASGVLVDLATFLPGMGKIVSLIPGRLYLQVCQGNWKMTVPLLGAAAISFLLSIIIDKIKKR